MSAPSPRILLVRLSALGDVIRALPVLATLRANLPDAEVSWLVEDRAAVLLRDHPQIDHLFEYPRRRWQGALMRPWRLPGVILEIVSFVRGMRRRRFDMSIDLQGNLKSAVLIRLIGAESRVGFARGEGREANHLFQNVHVPMEKGIHKMDRGLKLLDAIDEGWEPVTSVVVPVSDGDRSHVTAFLEREGLPAGGYAVLHPGTSAFADFKRWPPDRFGALAAWIREHTGWPVLVTWGAEEEDLANRVVSASDGAARMSPAWASLGQLAALLESAGLVVGADTGPAHLAAALGAPTVTLFGPKDPVLYSPYGDRATVVCHRVSCSPCTKRDCRDPICMTRLSIDEVMGGVERVLDTT
jgi:lipopolysaccharide heptosyltransferase I